ncbi:hypothetical protein HNQ59_003926 [Chitinivorax tropicus]|uniref:Uncharacterized protein n=1 Tax=Chitinivorax tropicus TaxID=714531 RepID=A0A840MZN5_9PROT|nr:hypothetical protein [Chitinivorax tropicus]MBB5020601.1 hypothetical protein [Chitinivorax tropicus]
MQKIMMMKFKMIQLLLLAAMPSVAFGGMKTLVTDIKCNQIQAVVNSYCDSPRGEGQPIMCDKQGLVILKDGKAAYKKNIKSKWSRYVYKWACLKTEEYGEVLLLSWGDFMDNQAEGSYLFDVDGRKVNLKNNYHRYKENKSGDINLPNYE